MDLFLRQETLKELSLGLRLDHGGFKPQTSDKRLTFWHCVRLRQSQTMQRLILLNNLPSLGPDPAQAGEKREIDHYKWKIRQVQIKHTNHSDKSLAGENLKQTVKSSTTTRRR